MMTKQNGFVAALLMTTAFTPMRTDAACTPTPDCAELGYTQTIDECPDNAVKCPWDTSKVFCYGSCDKEYKYTCTGENETAGLCKCGGKYAVCRCAEGYGWVDGHCVRPNCQIGDIFYTDYTCVAAANHDSMKEVLGIVVYITDGGNHGQIMAPWNITESGKKTSNDVILPWAFWRGGSPSQCNVMNSGSSNTLSPSNNFDSCKNTSNVSCPYYPCAPMALNAVLSYTPTLETSGKWCLPASGIFTNIKNNLEIIQAAFAKVGGTAFHNGIWSSESNRGQTAQGESCVGAIVSNLNAESGLFFYNAQGEASVRPVLEY